MRLLYDSLRRGEVRPEPNLTRQEKTLKIKVDANVLVPGIPESFELQEGSCLRDALLIVAPTVIDRKTGSYVDDPDIWHLGLNEESFWQLKEGLDTMLQEGDTVRIKVRFCLC